MVYKVRKRRFLLPDETVSLSRQCGQHVGLALVRITHGDSVAVTRKSPLGPRERPPDHARVKRVNVAW